MGPGGGYDTPPSPQGSPSLKETYPRPRTRRPNFSRPSSPRGVQKGAGLTYVGVSLFRRAFSGTLNPGSRIPDPGSRIPDPGSRIQDVILGLRPLKKWTRSNDRSRREASNGGLESFWDAQGVEIEAKQDFAASARVGPAAPPRMQDPRRPPKTGWGGHRLEWRTT